MFCSRYESPALVTEIVIIRWLSPPSPLLILTLIKVLSYSVGGMLSHGRKGQVIRLLLPFVYTWILGRYKFLHSNPLLLWLITGFGSDPSFPITLKQYIRAKEGWLLELNNFCYLKAEHDGRNKVFGQLRPAVITFWRNFLIIICLQIGMRGSN